MREEKWKSAVETIAKHHAYATTSIACEEALKRDTAEGYRDALHKIANTKQNEYAVVIDTARDALKDD